MTRASEREYDRLLIEGIVRRETTITLRDVARRLDLSQAYVEELSEESEPVFVNTGIGGFGIQEYGRRGDYVLEWTD